MLIQTAKFEIDISEDSTYTPRSVDNVRTYDREYIIGEYPSSRFGIIVGFKGNKKHSCIVIAGGGATTVHEHTALIIGDNLFIAIGDLVCCLLLPNLELKWHCKSDTATCFGIHFSSKYNCIISHGECEVSRLSLAGQLVWRASGKDIFTGDFMLYTDHIEVIDFNNEKYFIDLKNGAVKTIGS